MDAASLEAADLKVISASECAPGSLIWAWWGRAGIADAYLRLSSVEGDRQSRFLRLSGDNAFSIAVISPERPRPVVVVANPPYRVELDREAMSASPHHGEGSIALTVDGPFVLARGNDQHGFSEMYYVSLIDFTPHAYLANKMELYAASWGLSISAPGLENGGTKILKVTAPISQA